MLMAEHRLINRMIALMKAAIDGIEASANIDPAFVASAVDFIRVYADHAHHAKEEKILFPDVAGRNLSPAHVAMMRSLVTEHEDARPPFGRRTVGCPREGERPREPHRSVTGPFPQNVLLFHCRMRYNYFRLFP